MKSVLPATFEATVIDDLPIELKPPPSKPKAQHKKAIAEAQAWAKFGVQVLRIKAKVLAALGREAENAGIKQIGHGKILVASDNAETAISKLGGIVDKLLIQEPGPDYPLVLEIMRLQREFNAQLLKTAEAHFSADRQPSNGTDGKSINIPYPAGAAIMVGVGKTQSAIEQQPVDT